MPLVLFSELDPGRVRLQAPGHALQIHGPVTSVAHARGCHKRQWARMRWNAAATAIRTRDDAQARRFLESVRDHADADAWIDELPAWTREPGVRIELVLSLAEGARVLAAAVW